MGISSPLEEDTINFLKCVDKFRDQLVWPRTCVNVTQICVRAIIELEQSTWGRTKFFLPVYFADSRRNRQT